MAGEQAFAPPTASLPWEADRPLMIDAAAAAIRASFPTISSEGLKHLGSGWEFDAFVTTDGWVFRFPRRADCANRFDSERRVHDLVSTVLPTTVAVPRVELVGQPSPGFPYRFAGHRFDGKLRVIHQHLSPEHVVVDAATGHVAGILDWTDTILGDSARDFVFLVTWRGWEFAEDVLRRYPHAVDRDFRERLRFMARLLSVMWLAMAHAQHGNVAMHIEWVRNAFAPRVRS